MRDFRVVLTCIVAAVLAVGVALGAATQAEGASDIEVCGFGYGHGVGLSQYGAKGRAEAGQGWPQIVRTYYRGVDISRSPDNPRVRVLLGAKLNGGAFDVAVRSGSEARLKNFSGGGTVDLGPGRYRTEYLSERDVYRVIDLSRREVVGVYGGPIMFLPLSGDPLAYRNTEYRGGLLVRATNNDRLHLINQLTMEGYLRGVVPKEMPPSWDQHALRAQAVAARSYALATQRGGPFDFYADVRSQVYGGSSAETPQTNRAVAGTSRYYAAYDGAPITAFFHSSNGGITENAENVFSNPVPYLKSVRDVDGAGQAYEGGAHAASPWIRWSGEIDPDGSPQFGVGSIESIDVLDRSSSVRVTKIRVTGSEGERTISGQQEIRFGLNTTGVELADGSTRPGGALPSTRRVSFGDDCG